MLDSSARISRTLSKAATQCGCIKIYAEKQQIPKLTENLEEMQSHMQTHIEELCDNCRELLKKILTQSLLPFRNM